MISGAKYPDVGTLTAVIARSPIVVQPGCSDGRRLPSGFDDVDIAVLEWIAAEARRARPRMSFYVM